jgi:hypothetical protein
MCVMLSFATCHTPTRRINNPQRTSQKGEVSNETELFSKVPKQNKQTKTKEETEHIAQPKK